MTRFQDKKYYEYLQVTRNADPEVIEGAYRRLAKKYHPDNNPNNLQSAILFQQITEAYETLHDPARRKAYDSWLNAFCSESTSQNTRSNTSASGSSASGSTASGSFHDAQFDFDMERVRKNAYANYDQWKGRAAGAAQEAASREASASENAVKRKRKPILAGAFVTVAVVCIVSFFALTSTPNGSEILAFAGLKSEAANETMSEMEADTTTTAEKTSDTATETVSAAETVTAAEAASDTTAETGAAADTDGSASGEGEKEAVIADDTQNTQQAVYEVTADPSLNVRQAADSSSAKLGSVYFGETYRGTGNISDDGKWIEIYYTSDGGETGWAYHQYLKEISENTDTQISEEQQTTDTTNTSEGSDNTDVVIIANEQTNTDTTDATTEATVKNTDDSVYKEMKNIIDSSVASFNETALNTRSLSLGGTVIPLAASGWGAGNILCYSSDKSVVTVSSSGTVTAVGSGEAYVFVFSKISIEVNKSLGSGIMYEAYKYKVR